MLGQSFSPIGDPQDPRVQNNEGGQGAANPVQEAIRVLSLKMPRVPGAGAPAPTSLLNGPGMSGMPSPNMGMPSPGPGMSAPGGEPPNPLEDLLRRILMGGFAGGPGSMPPQDSGPGPMTPNLPQAKPHVEFQPNPGGIATDPRVRPGQRELEQPSHSAGGPGRIFRQ